MWITPHNTVSSRPVWLLTTQVAKGRHHRRSLHIYWHFMSPRNDIIMGSISAPNRRQSLCSTYYYYLNLEPSNNYIGTALDNKNWFINIINQSSPFKNHDQRRRVKFRRVFWKVIIVISKKAARAFIAALHVICSDCMDIRMDVVLYVGRCRLTAIQLIVCAYHEKVKAFLQALYFWCHWRNNNNKCNKKNMV